MGRIVSVALVALRCCHSVPQHTEEAHIGPESSVAAEVRHGEAPAGGSMIRVEPSRGRRKSHGGSTMFEVKASGELKYHTDSTVSVPSSVSAAAALETDGTKKAAVSRSVGAELVANATSGKEAEDGASGQDVGTAPTANLAANATSASEAEEAAHDPSSTGGSQPSDAASGSPANLDANATGPRPDLSSFPMEKLALLQSGQEEAPVTEHKQTDELPGERLISEMLQEGGHAATIEKAEEGAAQIPGLANVGDIAFRAMDMMLGTTGIIATDYPFACICNAQGLCERDIQNTPCPHRAGQMAAARLSASSGAYAVLLTALTLCVQISR